MGLSICYNGKFKRNMQLSDMIEEVKDVAEANDWSYTIFETDFNIVHSTDDYDELFGMVFSPESCEPIQFTFSADRIMCSYMYVKLFDSNPDMIDLKRTIFTKTQYAGVEVHKVVIHLIRYISNKYFDDFTLTDEGYYWETNDEDKLNEQFRIFNTFIDMFGNGLKTTPMIKGESYEDYIKRIVNNSKM